jgi:DNA-binding transcriptional MerR regulator
VQEQLFRVRAFAELAGVTVRALHHYDRLGLLRPKRTRAGYRVYCLRDLERLEQIVALKFLGLPLKDIKGVVNRDGRPLSDVLRAQRRALEETRRRLDRAIAAIADAERSLTAGQPLDPAIARRIITSIDMQDNRDAMQKYHSDEGWAEVERRRREMTPDQHKAAEDGTRKWLGLFKDVEAALGEDPTGANAQTLLARWDALIFEFTQGNTEIAKGAARAWNDRQNWPADLKRVSEPFGDKRVWEFIQKARASRAERSERTP